LANASAFVLAGRKYLSRCMFWGQSMGPVADETLKFGTWVHCEDLGAKDMSGGVV